MATEMAWAAERMEDMAIATSPFTLWEGGRDAGSAASLGSDGASAADSLAMAIETPSLIPVPTHRRFDESASVEACDSTAAMALPVAAPLGRTRRHGEEVDVAGTRRGLDWRMIGASILLFFSMALGAMAVRAATLDAAYKGLTWEEHQVIAGESIGSILAGRDLPDVGFGRLIDWVEERNGLPDATILPGQTLSIPV